MYLRELRLKNFRSFDDLILPFQKDLTVLVGENNGGKSNLIDGIRLVTTPLGGRREIYCEHTDIRFGSAKPEFDIEATFAELTPAQQGSFLSAAVDASIDPVKFGITYKVRGSGLTSRPMLWAGAAKSPPEPGCHELIRHVYLPPLRDAKRALASGNPGRIYALLSHFLNPGQAPEEVARNLARGPNDPILERVDTAVETGLSALTSGVRRQAAALGFSSDEKLIDIARDLRFKLSDHGLTPEDLRYSGHGYANLLYIATIAVELERMVDADLTIFLVEEPEAHLHPQLQAAVLGFLEEKALQSRAKAQTVGPAGQLQIVVATHSPNLSAWVESKKIMFLKTIIPTSLDASLERDEPPTQEVASAPTVPEPPGQPPGGQQGSRPIPPRRVTKCLPLFKLNLDIDDQRKIDRYLDVTKSAVLFGGRVMIVEGIAEALLLPVIARKIIFKNDKEKLRLFRSAVFVPIDGVDFDPYAKLLLTSYNGVRIADRLVIMTDGDKTTVAAGEILPGAARKTKLDAIATQNGATSILDVLVNTYSLEIELVRSGNAELLRLAYLELHPRSAPKWDEAIAKTDDAQAQAIQGLFADTRKGDFAQIIAKAISEDRVFHVPAYMTEAINALVR